MADDIDLEVLTEVVMHEHLYRMDLCHTVPLERRGPRRRKRPNTALISEAADKAIAARELKERSWEK